MESLYNAIYFRSTMSAPTPPPPPPAEYIKVQQIDSDEDDEEQVELLSHPIFDEEIQQRTCQRTVVLLACVWLCIALLFIVLRHLYARSSFIFLTHIVSDVDDVVGLQPSFFNHTPSSDNVERGEGWGG